MVELTAELTTAVGCCAPLAREPMTFDDSKARRELGYGSRPAAEALVAAARAALDE